MLAVISDTLITAAIVTPVMLFLVVLFLRSGPLADKRDADALAPRLKCPDCGTHSLVWAEGWWVVKEMYDNNQEKEWSGLTFRCGKCRKEFEFTRDGVRFDVDWKDRKSEK